ncbi:spermidine/putrescine ABC transporter ATPase subunit [Cupriavidus sp. GA3-3]|uniref:ABC transporter ATP-binding protein n=1 Tax=Cupriavidus sp. GA3-3 TaxID=1229514 RepID=UPI000331078A|nr:ABC transporter ATP-binding protein [Cupriavidus sp. GA3-3]EON18724.1 spermidine/putrescine ABC transporter ATPase subunit [Cupriavidus sp. GA3-3]
MLEHRSAVGGIARVARMSEPVIQGGQSSEKLRIAGLSKRYGETFALTATDLVVQQGEFVTLLGPSGSGKTTLLMMIAGLTQPTSGEIWIEKKDATFSPPHRRDIGMMFQSYALFPHMTVAENIGFPLRMRGMSAEQIRQEVDAILDLIKLPGIHGRFPTQLSGGQQQRVALARAIVHKPSIVLMDEPLAALDKALRSHMQTEIRQLQKALGITVLYVTHDQEEAMTMSDRICLMNNAAIEQIGSPEDLYFSPRTLFAGQFLGDSNCVRGKLSGIDAASGTGTLSLPCGMTLRGRVADSAKVGASAVLLVRPESIRVGADKADANVNQISCAIEECTVMGSLSRTRMKLDDGSTMVSVGLTQATKPITGGRSQIAFDAPTAIIFGEKHV